MFYIFIQNDKINGAGQCRQLTEGVTNFEVDEEFYNSFIEAPDKYIWNGENIVENPEYEKEQAQKRENVFNEQFFKTSLGWVKRTVTMKDGSERSFLMDILPLLQPNIPVITYNEPDFTTDENPTQNRGQIVTEAFLQECKMQVLNDFYGDIPVIEEPQLSDTEEPEEV